MSEKKGKGECPLCDKRRTKWEWDDGDITRAHNREEHEVVRCVTCDTLFTKTKRDEADTIYSSLCIHCLTEKGPRP